MWHQIYETYTIFSEDIFISGEDYIINVAKESFHVKIYQEM